MTILQQPDALSLSMNLKKFIISSDTQISFVLKKGTEEVLSQRYDPDSQGRIEIDMRDVVHAQLAFDFRGSAVRTYEQTNLHAEFTAEIDGQAVNFHTVRGGVDNLADTATNFLTQNWLTWQPTVKPVTYYTPEFLTYYAPVAGVVKLRGYFVGNDGQVTSQKDIELCNVEAGKAYTIPVEYQVVVSLLYPDGKPGYYDVWVENASGERLTYIQRYYADAMRSISEDWVLFENSLGGVDCFRAYGKTNLEADHTHNLAEVDEMSEEYRVDTERKYEKNTGHLSKDEARWLLDFFPSQKKYIYVGSYLRQIVVVESNVTGNLRELPTNYTFTYKYADARPLLNLPRTDVPADMLDITIPEVGNFTIPPRLAEVPRLPLSEGDLFPVQNPYSETWNTTTVGAIADVVGQLLAAAAGTGGGVGHTHKNIDLLNLLSYIQEYLLVNGKKIKAGYADTAGSLAEGKYIRKDQPDETEFLIKFLGGLISDNIQSQDFTTGALGAGFCLKKDDNGDSYLEVDRALFRKTATFIELLIQKLRHVGGQIILSPASMSCAKVEEHDTFYRCYFETTDGDKTIEQEFVTGDQARCQTFNIREGVSENVSNTYYWRLVVGVGDNYIDLSKTDCDAGSTVPQAGDDIVLLGNRTDVTRQAAVILSAYGNDAPYAKMYRGIHSYNMSEAEEFFSASRTELHIIANRILMSTTGKDVETSISDAQLLAAALSKGTMMFTNPTFKNLAGQRYNKMGAYNSAIVQWVTDDSIGNDSGMGVRVTLRNNGRNGFFWNVPGGANYEYLAYFVAKIPIGLTAAHTAQANSELDAHWLTTNKGTGQWKEYACHIKYRSTPQHDQINGEFGRCCYFSFSGTVEYPAEILIRYATVYRLNSYTLYATDSYVRSQFEITNDKIESSVESVSSSTNAYSLNTFLQLNESAMTVKYPDFKRPGYHKWRNGMTFYDSMGYSSWRFITNDQDYVDEHGAIFDQSGKYDGMNDLVWEVTEVLNQLTPGNSRGIVFNVSAKPGKMIVVKIRALLPKGYELSGNAYNIGTIEASQGWLTSKVGTGVYKDYVYYVKYGNDVVEQGKRNNIWIRLYKDGGMNGQTEKWYITWAAVYNLTNATQDDLDGKYEYLRTNIQQTDAKIESTAERISYDLSMLSTAEMLNDDPTFRSSTGGLMTFNGIYGKPELTRVRQSSPNGSGYVLNVQHAAAEYFHVHAGVCWDYPSKQDKKYVFRLTAKIPSGWKLGVHATAIGGGTQGWFEGTDLNGDGQWHDYFYIVQCGNSGKFDPVGRFGIIPESGTAIPADGIEWQLCFAAAYDLTDETFRSETRTSIKQTADEIALTAERVGDAEAQLKVQADEINLKVSKDEYNGKEIKSLINMSPTGIRIQASQLDLIGAITISMLGSGLQATINNIKEKANAAVPVDDFDNMLEDAVVNGKTLIAGGFINTELINVMNLVAHKIEAATGSFYSLTCINESNVGVGKITFNSNGQLTFEGDILHQGTPSGTTRGYRFLTNTVWCRGAFGARYRTTAYIARNISTNIPYIYIYERATLIYNAPLSSGTDSSGNTYYIIPGFMESGAASGMPVDTIAFSLSDNVTYRFKLDLGTHQRVTLVNLNDDDNGRINLYSNGKLVTLAGGCGLSAQKFVTNMMNPVNSNLGAGILFTAGQYDNNWK